MLNLLDLCAAAATERGDLDETRRIIERTIELAPYDDDRYLKVASSCTSREKRRRAERPLPGTLGARAARRSAAGRAPGLRGDPGR